MEFHLKMMQAAREGATIERMEIMYRGFAETHEATLKLALGATRQCQLLTALRA
jgi:hypothetical protein